MGKICLRAIIDHPELELSRLYVYSDSKVGKDAGDIAHRDKTGVIATNDIEDILSLDADVVFHCPKIHPPYTNNDEDICRLLDSDKNVICISGHNYPQHWGDAYTKPFLDACCSQGNSTLLGSGLNPGFITDKIATIAASMCLEVEHIEITETIARNYPFKTTAEQYGAAGSLVNSVPGLVSAPPGFWEIPLVDPALVLEPSV